MNNWALQLSMVTSSGTNLFDPVRLFYSFYYKNGVIFFVGGRKNKDAEWETCIAVPDFYWKQIAEPVMKLYTETTDGSTIETKESGLVWNYQYADPDFGSCQAKELLDHLESVLANEPVTVKSGQNIVEVKPQVSNLFPFSKLNNKRVLPPVSIHYNKIRFIL